MELLRSHNAIVREQIREHQGHEVKSWGDAFMVVFANPRRALQCAIEVQRAMATHNEGAEEPVRVRIGLHTGEAVQEAEDFYGRHVNLTSRIANQATGGEILVSSLLKELTASDGGFAFGEGREVALKGVPGEQQVFQVEWE
jgi:class 3 adenylate cyclase